MSNRNGQSRLCVVGLSLCIAAGLAFIASTVTAGEGELVRITTFKFKPGATSEQVKAVEDGFAVLKQNIPQIVTLKWGTIVKPDKQTKGFTHGLVLTFKSEADRDIYGPHPAHQELIKKVIPIVEDITVFEFWNKG